MACRNSVASEEFADFIAPYFTSPENFMRSQGTDCIDFVNSTLAVVYIPFSTITSFSYTSYTYSAIPKLYSLLDVTSMDAAGITAAGELPVLNNQGGRSSYWICGYRGSIIWILCFGARMGVPESLGYGTRHSRRLLKPHPSSRSFTAANILLPRSIWP